jgi:hypothetical protein
MLFGPSPTMGERLPLGCPTYEVSFVSAWPSRQDSKEVKTAILLFHESSYPMEMVAIGNNS